MGHCLLPCRACRCASREEQHRRTARVAMFSSSGATVGAVVYPDSDLVWVWTADDAVDMVVKRSSKVDDIAPWIDDPNGTDTDTDTDT